jgi:tetratricopeptide (TPR) repeat protein
MRGSAFALSVMLLAASTASAQHLSHRLAPIPLSIVERPATLRTGIGRAHDDTSTASKEAQALYDQGLAYLHSYVWIEAARSFNAALKIDPKLALAQVGLSIAYVELNRPAEARAALDTARAAAAALSDHDRRHVEARALQMAAEDAPGDATRLAAYRRALDAAIAAHPKDVEFVLSRGMAETNDPAERGQGSTQASAKYYERALSLVPNYMAAWHYLAHAAENGGRQAEALEHSAAYAKAAADVPHARHMHGHNLRRGGRIHDAIIEFEAADRLHREYIRREQIPGEYDWHYEHNLGLLGTSLQYVGQMKRAEAVLKTAFALPTGLLVQAYNKREWPMFLRARGRYQDAEAAAKMLIASPNPVVQATGHIEAGLTYLAVNRWGDAGNASNAALKLLRAAPGGAIAANALLSLQGEFYLRTAAREKGRATLEDVAKRVRSAPGPDLWAQALFTLEALARAARAVGDWELAGRLARQMIDHDASYPGSHYALALVAEHDDDTATATAEFKQALTLWSKAEPDLPELVEVRKKLRSTKAGRILPRHFPPAVSCRISRTTRTPGRCCVSA